MGQLRPLPSAKLLIASLVSTDAMTHLPTIDAALTDAFGPIDIVGEPQPFELTEYYLAEMGAGVVRRMISFAGTIDPGRLAEIKLACNAMEAALTKTIRPNGAGRAVNLDAGYLTLSQMVLATTKSYSHRIYLRDGIYAEVTLRYLKGRYEPWPWTYPDYADGRYNDFLVAMRDSLKRDLAGPHDVR